MGNAHAGLFLSVDYAGKGGMKQTLIISDLDGTLLDARTYSFEEARPALELIRRNDLPLILCSSKTRAELEVWRNRLENHHPFITENGGGIFIPERYFPFPVAGQKGVILLSAGSDGTDGPTDAAGAIVDGDTVLRAKELGLSADDYLANNDSYSFYKKSDMMSGETTHLITGPTGTDVMDLQIMLINGRAA